MASETTGSRAPVMSRLSDPPGANPQPTRQLVANLRRLMSERGVVPEKVAKAATFIAATSA